jgi:hypothetical protein
MFERFVRATLIRDQGVLTGRTHAAMPLRSLDHFFLGYHWGDNFLSMSSTIDQYRDAKNSYFKLRNQAKKELIARFNELANELLQLQRELLEDFGEKVIMPSRSKKGRAGKTQKTVQSPKQPAAQPAAPSPKVLGIQKQLEQQKKKLASVQTAGKPTKAIEDRIYELEDELRLVHAS